MNERSVRALSIRFVAIFGMTHALSQFLRASNAVIAPELISDLGLSSASLGALTGAFFLSFALVQVPVGILLDRFGPRIVVSLLMLLTVAGAALFAFGHGLAELTAARVLMGVGCAPVLMGAYVIYARWFDPAKFSSYAAAQLSISNGGLILATAPLALAVAAIGWRASIGMAGLWAALFVGGILLLVRDAPSGHAAHSARHETLRECLKGVADVVADRRLWPLLPLQFVGYGTIASILTLWGGPYLADVHGLETVARGNVLLLMAAGSIVGALVYGPLDRLFNTRRGVVLTGSTAVAGVFALLALYEQPPLALVVVMFAALSVLGAYMLVLVSHIRALLPDHLMGRGLTLTNMLTMGGVAVMQPVTGSILDALSGDPGRTPPEWAYRSVFGFLCGVLILAVAVYSRSIDILPRAAVEEAT